MNERQFSVQIKNALDESADHLPYKVAHRLSAARESALSRMPADGAALMMRQASGSGPVARMEAGLGWRFAGILVPVCILVIGLFSLQAWDVSAKAEELADVQAAMLTDEVPIDTYADRGFGVFVKNSRQ